MVARWAVVERQVRGAEASSSRCQHAFSACARCGRKAAQGWGWWAPRARPDRGGAKSEAGVRGAIWAGSAARGHTSPGPLARGFRLGAAARRAEWAVRSGDKGHALNGAQQHDAGGRVVWRVMVVVVVVGCRGKVRR